MQCFHFIMPDFLQKIQRIFFHQNTRLLHVRAAVIYDVNLNILVSGIFFCQLMYCLGRANMIGSQHVERHCAPAFNGTANYASDCRIKRTIYVDNDHNPAR